jgi:hypothetical protein
MKALFAAPAHVWNVALKRPAGLPREGLLTEVLRTKIRGQTSVEYWFCEIDDR